MSNTMISETDKTAQRPEFRPGQREALRQLIEGFRGRNDQEGLEMVKQDIPPGHTIASVMGEPEPEEPQPQPQESSQDSTQPLTPETKAALKQSVLDNLENPEVLDVIKRGLPEGVTLKSLLAES